MSVWLAASGETVAVHTEHGSLVLTGEEFTELQRIVNN